MKLVFMGSPEFAVPSLEALIEARFDVRLVVTQPDRKAGRGRRLEPTAVKRCAQFHEIPVISFGRGDRKTVSHAVLEEKPDAIVVVAFGHILKEPLLSKPPLGCLNVHASLLPRWRGISPIQFAILHGDAWSGVTVMQMDAGVDTGPILAQRPIPIQPEETAGELAARLSGLGADLLVHTVRDLAAGLIEPQPQGDQGAVYAPKLTRSLSPVRWDRPVTVVHNQIRGLQPFPGATSILNEGLVKITAANPWSYRTAETEPGTILAVNDDGLQVACGEGILLVTRLQCPGRKELTVAQFVHGREVHTGQAFRS
jgi:methionyl-tRNA formyltransferase